MGLLHEKEEIIFCINNSNENERMDIVGALNSKYIKNIILKMINRNLCI